MRRISATNAKGFTLLEVMLVILLMGLLAVAVSLALPDSSRALLERDARVLQARVALAMEQAIYRNRDYGLAIGTQGYRFLQRERDRWIEPPADAGLDSVTLHPATRLRLDVDGRPLRLGPKGADTPQLLLLSDGQVTPFELSIGRDDQARRYRLSASFAGDLRLQEDERP